MGKILKIEDKNRKMLQKKFLNLDIFQNFSRPSKIPNSENDRKFKKKQKVPKSWIISNKSKNFKNQNRLIIKWKI